ncbi:dihydrofolate reductase [Solirubrobacter phytolaccae]|uniref:Dihydrofolate reductase n=1 Tax=Solirubrobacter phytolaccae TaxID=1404360 RepID=A0A9X3SDA8_9ACTN|nr:dihydrofolate reductase [Solirubrobacter phytolaccae]MDA0183470.1 dihydrofolate reductase [Solirubrobacter phytolaccae]
MSVSTDGYIKDAEGGFDFAETSDEVFRWWIDFQRRSVLDLYGRAIYEDMRYWETLADDATDAHRDFADAWQKTPKIVVSTTLESVEPYARLVREPAHVPSAEGMVTIEGASLAASMIDRIDEFWPVVYPTTVGGGTPFFPAGVRLNLKLVETRRFDSGAVLLRYQRA